MEEKLNFPTGYEYQKYVGNFTMMVIMVYIIDNDTPSFTY
jgi:hypothetical protein